MNNTQCANCGKEVKNGEGIRGVWNNQTYRFCSFDCSGTYIRNHPGKPEVPNDAA